MSDLRKYLLEEEEITYFRELNLEEMKRWAEANRRAKLALLIIAAGVALPSIVIVCVYFGWFV